MIFTVSAEHAAQRLDLFLAERWAQAQSRSEVQRLIKAGNVRIDGLVVSRVSTKVDTGQVVRIEQAEPDQVESVARIAPGDAILDVVYEDDDIAVIDKPAGTAVHPGAGRDSGTLVNAVVARWPRIADVGEPGRPGVVHRLDRDTSGLLVIALKDEAYSRLSEMILKREIERIYTTLVHGHPASAAGVVDAPIGRDPHHRTRQAIVENGRPSRTHYRVVRKYEDYSLLEVRLETGRMHQVRVHMDAISHPVVGDQTYGKRGVAANGAIGRLDRQFLHASRLEFRHPISGEPVSVNSELPDDLASVLASLADG